MFTSQLIKLWVNFVAFDQSFKRVVVYINIGILFAKVAKVNYYGVLKAVDVNHTAEQVVTEVVHTAHPLARSWAYSHMPRGRNAIRGNLCSRALYPTRCCALLCA